jgi:hypothetical protein
VAPPDGTRARCRGATGWGIGTRREWHKGDQWVTGWAGRSGTTRWHQAPAKARNRVAPCGGTVAERQAVEARAAEEQRSRVTDDTTEQHHQSRGGACGPQPAHGPGMRAAAASSSSSTRPGGAGPAGHAWGPGVVRGHSAGHHDLAEAQGWAESWLGMQCSAAASQR